MSEGSPGILIIIDNKCGLRIELTNIRQSLGSGSDDVTHHLSKELNWTDGLTL